ncbi:hypothetical protein T4B_15233 [Trichinella pseudospiralis]|uniref:Uncharacterized protein n=1 Tax=Trichinella pseudospiralis TaxID=6337 RepID=A0A0V1E984_TRIPS|nr:hypothetical protein T4A_6805 [Trichinella pseudospiralis]KRZ01536.1 hypothetical protein T4B_15233 [Trichinella pseudospiralis]KRZ34418.1 hypothetical protein T4C_5553 [Trichinella pseudospiralis]
MHAKEAVIRSVIAGLSAILASKIAKIEGYCPRGHCRYTVYDMLTKKEEEYSIFMSEVCSMTNLIFYSHSARLVESYISANGPGE